MMVDLLKDMNADLQIVNNDLVMGQSDDQHREDLLLCEKGSIKQFPETGVGAYKFLESEDHATLLREISLQFSADGMNVKTVAMQNGQIVIDAPYK